MDLVSKYADLAHEFLKTLTKYFFDKTIIKNNFSSTSENYSEESIISRLTLIDSYYSTQMNKRYFGIEDVAEMIFGLSKSENEVKEMFRDFARNQQNKSIGNLFDYDEYGISKEGTPAGKAISLISKYVFILTKRVPLFLIQKYTTLI